MNILEKLNSSILLVTISYIMALSNLLSNFDDIGPQVRLLIAFFTSAGLFRLLILLVYWRSMAPILCLRFITATSS